MRHAPYMPPMQYGMSGQPPPNQQTHQPPLQSPPSMQYGMNGPGPAQPPPPPSMQYGMNGPAPSQPPPPMQYNMGGQSPMAPPPMQYGMSGQSPPAPPPIQHGQLGGQLPPTQPPMHHNMGGHPAPPPMHHGMGGLPPQQPRAMRLDYKAVPSAADFVKKEIETYQQTDRRLTFTAPATLPPLVTTLESSELKMTLLDGGCARPCHMRSSIYQVPISKDILDNSGLEFSVVVKPFDETEVGGQTYIPLSMSEIVRCNICQAYANPFSRNGQCCMCDLGHFAIQGVQGPDQRPELNLGSYEFRASAEYYRDNIAEPRRPHIIFAIEATANSRHLVHHISKHLANVIKNHWPTDFLYSASLSPLVGFATYNSKITIYDVKNGGHAYVIPDVTSAGECPWTPNFLVDPSEKFEMIEKFLESLPRLCQEDLELQQQTVLGPVLEAVLKTCLHDVSSYFQKPNPKVKPTGKMYILHSSLPTSGDEATPGRLGAKRDIDNMKRQLGTETEAKVLKPDGKYYSTLAKKCVDYATGDYSTGIEIFLFPPNPKVYLNVATLSDLACLTGTGIVNKYHISSMNNFTEDLKMSLESTMGFDASLRVRTSRGISPVKYIGHFNNAPPNIEMSTVNTSSNFLVQMKYDDKIPENDLVLVQFAMIYTSVCGERRVRVHNLALTTCQSYQDLYKMACCDTLMNALARDSLDKMTRLGTLNPKTAKEQLTTRITSILAAYRKYCSEGSTSSSQLILPEGLKLLPVYLCGALKCDAIDGGMEMYPDDKVISQIKLLGALPSMSQVTFYPRMYAIVACEADDESNVYGLTTSLTRCLRAIIDEDPAQCYVLDNGHYLFIYFTNTELGNRFLGSVFGGRKDEQDLFWDYRNTDSNESKFLEELIARIVRERRRTMAISVVRQGRDRLENVFNSFLYEDKKRPDLPSVTARHDNLAYTDMLCYLHAEIRAKLSQ